MAEDDAVPNGENTNDSLLAFQNKTGFNIKRR